MDKQYFPYLAVTLLAFLTIAPSIAAAEGIIYANVSV